MKVLLYVCCIFSLCYSQSNDIDERLDRIESAKNEIQDEIVGLIKEFRQLQQTLPNPPLTNANFDINTGRSVFTYDWIIPDYSNQPLILERSPPFYIGPRSYRMLMVFSKNIPAAEDSKRKQLLERYVAVFATVIKGRYDDEIAWPFTIHYQLSVLDQDNIKPIHYESDIYPGEDCVIEKPKLQGLPDNWVECGTLLQVRKDVLITRNYLKNDQIKIRFKAYLE